MPLDILKNQKDRLIRRAISRSYVRSSTHTCPICDKKKKIIEVMKEIKNQFHPQNDL